MTDIQVTDDRESLKQQAKQLGLEYKDNIPTDKLKALIDGYVPVVEKSEGQLRKEALDEAMRLVRVIVTNNNPNKQELLGEIFAVGNAYIATVKRYVPFGATDGFHVEQILLNQIQDKKYQSLITKKGPNGEYKESKLVPEYNVVILPQLTEEELKALALVQQGDE